MKHQDVFFRACQRMRDDAMKATSGPLANMIANPDYAKEDDGFACMAIRSSPRDDVASIEDCTFWMNMSPNLVAHALLNSLSNIISRELGLSEKIGVALTYAVPEELRDSVGTDELIIRFNGDNQELNDNADKVADALLNNYEDMFLVDMLKELNVHAPRQHKTDERSDGRPTTASTKGHRLPRRHVRRGPK